MFIPVENSQAYFPYEPRSFTSYCRFGIGHNTDMGIKVYPIGVMWNTKWNFEKEGKYKPALALVGGWGTLLWVPVLFEASIIASKSLGSLTAYGGGRIIGMEELDGTGVFLGSNIQLFPRFSLFFEMFYGRVNGYESSNFDITAVLITRLSCGLGLNFNLKTKSPNKSVL